MANDVLGALTGRDLVVIGLPGVQRFIAEARSTSDVRAASEVFTRFAARAAEVCREEGGELIFPSPRADDPEPAQAAAAADPDRREGMPNRVVALLPAGSGADAARKAQDEVAKLWRDWVRRALKLDPETDTPKTPETPGMPVVQWVSVPAGAGGYKEQWDTAQRLLAARRRVKDFGAGMEWSQRALCSIGPRWPAERESPPGLREHEKATLSAAAWVKRRWRKLDRDLAGFPSTASIASAPFRKAVLGYMGDDAVHTAVAGLARTAREVIHVAQGGDVRESRVRGLPEPEAEPGKWFASTGGPWVYTDQWQLDSLAREMKVDATEIGDAAARGLKAAIALRDLMEKRGAAPLAGYLALLVADIDGMGRFLSEAAGNEDHGRIVPSSAVHQAVSAAVQDLAKEQRDLLEGSELLGVPVYAGGDDLLAFVPAATSLDAAQQCHEVQQRYGKSPPWLPTASTAVLFFHYHASLQGAVTRARRMLEAAKGQSDDKHGLAVGYLRRSGVSEASVQPWPGANDSSTAQMFGVFTAAQGHQLSPRLLADLERDARELGELSARAPDFYRAELGRLVLRHTGGEPARARESAKKAAETLEWLGRHEAAEPPRAVAGDTRDAQDASGARPQVAARVGVFLRQEAR